MGLIHTKKCPKCTQTFETSIINWDKIPSRNNFTSLKNHQPDDFFDSLWVSLNKYLVIDVEEKQKLLIKEKEEKINEKNKIVNFKKSKIKEEANKILSEMEKSLRELNEKDNEISTEIEKIFQKNQQEIEKESKFIKQRVDNRQVDLNNMEILKKKSDDLKNQLNEKSTEIKNIKINIETIQYIKTNKYMMKCKLKSDTNLWEEKRKALVDSPKTDRTVAILNNSPKDETIKVTINVGNTIANSSTLEHD